MSADSAGLPLAAWLERIERHAIERAREPALCIGDEVLDYATLMARVRTVAAALRARGVTAGEVVGVQAERGVASIVTLLALLRLGAVYAPLHPHAPAAAIVAFSAAAGFARIVVDTGTRDDLGALQSVSWAALNEAVDDAPCRPWQGAVLAAAYAIQTSGSSGPPKAVLVSRANLAAHLGVAIERYGLDARSRVLHVCAPSFDVALEEVLPTLAAGGCVVVAPDVARDGLDAFDACLRDARVDVANLPTALWAAWLDHLAARGAAPPSTLRLLVIGGEACPPARAREWTRRYPGTRCVNGYGLSETTITNADFTLATPDTDAAVAVGRAWPRNTLHVLDEAGQPVATGESGELCIGGDFVATGYLGAPRETAARFVPDPFAPQPGARLFRSGDRAFVDAHGDVVVLGRIDRQLKLHGHRIEPEAIERRLERVPGVRQAHVARRDVGGQPRLLAWLQVEPGFAATRGACLARHDAAVARVLDEVADDLPPYQRPSHVAFLDALPTTPNGKVDLRALPLPGAVELDASGCGASSEPRESALAAAFGQRPQLDAGFYDQGGDSVLALRVIAALRGAGWELELAQLLAAPTLHAALCACRPVAPDTAPRSRGFIAAAALGRDELLQLRAAHPDWNNVEFFCGITPMQQQMLRASLEHPRSGNCIEQVEGELEALDVDAFRDAWAQVARRHEALRSAFTFALAGRPLLACRRDPPGEWRRADWRDLPPRAQAARLAHYLEADRREEFAWNGTPMTRWHLLQLDARRHHFIWTYHHALLDGWSDVMLLREVFATYDARRRATTPVLPVPGSYRDYAAWRQHSDAAGALQWWRAQLAGLDPARRWRLASPRGGRGFGADERILDAAHGGALDALARRLALPTSTLYAAAFASALATERSVDEVVFGQFVWHRPTALPQLATTAGLFINFVPVRVAPTAQADIATLLRGLFAAQLAREPHLHPDADAILACAPGSGALVDAALVVENYADATEPQIARLRNHAQSTLPLNLFVWPGARLRIELRHDRAWIGDALAQRVLQRCCELLRTLPSATTTGDWLRSADAATSGAARDVVTVAPD